MTRPDRHARRADSVALPWHERSAGFLLHVTSLPGPYGAGDLGGVKPLLEFAEQAGLRWWQTLPIHPPDGFASPYQSPSSFAGHPGLIDLELLARRGWLKRAQLRTARLGASAACDFEGSRRNRERLLRKAFASFDRSPPKELGRFLRKQGPWLKDWALFCALRHENHGAPWQEWPSEQRDRTPAALRAARSRLAQELRYQVFLQYAFDASWREFRASAAAVGVRLLGDLPMFVAADSADAWAHPELFQLDARGRIETEAGTPPDAFTRHGQRWGVPTYRVQAHRATGYAWWLRRIRRELELFDALRLDHFIGFVRTWSIPREHGPGSGGSRRRKEGYQRGLGRGLFRALEQRLGPLPFLSEDLGDAGEDVDRLRRSFRFPSMKVLQFGLDGLQGDNGYLPHTWSPDCVAYSGTHDNPTSVGWFKRHRLRVAGSGTARQDILRYTGGRGREIHEALARVLYTSVARTVVLPFQDILGLGSSARMNIPGRAAGNWSWRLELDEIPPNRATELRRLAEITGRLHSRENP